MTVHSYTKETQYLYTCGRCTKTWMAYNFFNIAVCPHCETKSIVYNKKECGINQTCACKK